MTFFVAAYLVLWVGLFGYLVWLGARIRALGEETRALARESQASSKPNAQASAPIEPSPRR
jgi:CcmD family protein